MARFVQFTRNSGDPVYLNPDHVVAVEPAGERHADIHLSVPSIDDVRKVRVEGAAHDVVGELESPSDLIF